MYLGLASLVERTVSFYQTERSDYYLSYAPVKVLPWHLLQVNVVLHHYWTLFVGASLLVSKINPIKTIHYR
jgi:hypothetical protein